MSTNWVLRIRPSDRRAIRTSVNQSTRASGSDRRDCGRDTGVARVSNNGLSADSADGVFCMQTSALLGMVSIGNSGELSPHSFISVALFYKCVAESKLLYISVSD